MPFIPHTPDDIAHMLDAIGVGHISALFDEIPGQLLNSTLSRVPEGLNEMQVTRPMREQFDQLPFASRFSFTRDEALRTTVSTPVSQ